MNDRSPGMGRYAQAEREQRWRIGEVPAGATKSVEINDWYLIGTRLRLRKSHDGTGQLFKFSQKVRVNDQDPELVGLTNMYLDQDEYTRLRQLPGREIHKSRWHAEHAGRRISIDEFHGRLEGLVLAETELEVSEDRLPDPSFAIEDVTNNDRYSGGGLAFASDADIALLLGSAGSS